MGITVVMHRERFGDSLLLPSVTIHSFPLGEEGRFGRMVLSKSSVSLLTQENLRSRFIGDKRGDVLRSLDAV